MSRFGELFDKYGMAAGLWALVAVLAGFGYTGLKDLGRVEGQVQGIYQVLERMDTHLERIETHWPEQLKRLETTVTEQMQRLESRIEARITQLETRIDARLERLTETLAKRFEATDKEFRTLHVLIAQYLPRTDAVEQRTKDLDERVKRLENR